MFKKNKLIKGVVFLLLVIFTGMLTVPRGAGAKIIGANYSQPELQNYQLIVSVPAKGVFVYGKKIAGRPYFEQVLVKTPSAQREYNWKATMWNARLSLADVTGTGQESIVIVFVTGRGTGFLRSEAHVIDMALTKEIPVEDARAAANRLIKSSIQGQDIVFAAGGKEYRVKPKVGAAGIEREHNSLYYGSIVNYEVVNNRLRATVTAETPYNRFLGEFTLEYTFKDGKLVPHVVNFIGL